jgi:hypothetical protein
LTFNPAYDTIPSVVDTQGADMKSRQKYVRLSQGQILVLPEQKEYAEKFIERAGISMNQYIRDVLQHASTCPFFNGRASTNGNVPPAEGPGA